MLVTTQLFFLGGDSDLILHSSSFYGAFPAIITIIATLLASGCVPQDPPETDMTGAEIVAALSGNTIVSDMATDPGPPAMAHLRKNGTLKGANLRRVQGKKAGIWSVNPAGYLCFKWPNWVEQKCGYVQDFHNGEYHWRGIVFKILPGNPKSF